MRNKIKEKYKYFYSKIYSSPKYQKFMGLVTLRGSSHFAPAALSFYLILSLIPCITLIEVIFSFINNIFSSNFSVLAILFAFDKKLTENVKNIFSVFTKSDVFSIIFSIFITIFLASKGLTFFSIQVKKMYGINYREQNFIKRKFIAIIFTLLLLILLAVLFVFLVIINSFFSIDIEIVKMLIYYFFILIILFIFIECLFVFSIEKGIKFNEVICGSLFSTLGIGIGIFIYYIYLKYISNSLNYYGPLSLVALLFLVCYYSSYILFLGVEINLHIKEKNLLHHKDKEDLNN